jgi:hypothetical protein
VSVNQSITCGVTKNPEIQKKARKLVDVWKKRVDAEMKVSGEAKPGSGHGISWTYKQSPAELVHPLTKIGSGGVVPEVGVKSSGTFAGNAKVTLKGMKSGVAPPVKSLSTPLVSNKSASVLFPPDLPTLKDSNCLPPLLGFFLKDSNKKSPALNVPSAADMSANPVKEEKSSSSSHNLSNGHSWGSATGKSVGNMTCCFSESLICHSEVSRLGSEQGFEKQKLMRFFVGHVMS